MTKTRINVIDLDGTLIPYDSFREYVFLFLSNYKTSFLISILVILRITRVLNAAQFKKWIILTARRVANYDSIMKRFAERISEDLDQSTLSHVQEYTNSNTVNILCSASPEDYLVHLSQLLDWQYKGSYFRADTEFVNLYGREKVQALEQTFPCSQYQYYFAISDSESDEHLLRKFKHYTVKN